MRGCREEEESKNHIRSENRIEEGGKAGGGGGIGGKRERERDRTEVDLPEGAAPDLATEPELVPNPWLHQLLPQRKKPAEPGSVHREQNRRGGEKGLKTRAFPPEI